MAAIVVALLLILVGFKPAGKGLVLGALFSAVNFFIMGKTLPYRIGRSPRKAFVFSLGSIIFRYLFLALPIVLAIKLDQFDLIAAIIGIFMVQLVILCDNFFLNGFSPH